ncbi:leucine rich repeat-containing protein [Chaetoceros tenuissimus]|uniref:Leucine rich repeat-containing protein n=1 Tax=Chaetoceros tenuissimus TaxID=426638 RepID=A0AAD3CN47_9STRA|nr:leucine rich repeat-containing protein [Chaetoceros tenuissimus]
MKVVYYDGKQWWKRGKFLVHTKKERETWEHAIIIQGVTRIKTRTFSNCPKLVKVTMASSVTVISEFAFCGCKLLREIVWSENIELIKASAFFRCTSLPQTLVIPRRCFRICESAFQFCSSITSLFIPVECEDVDDSAFDHCSSLKIVVLSSTTDIGSEVFKATKLFELSPFDTYDDESFEAWFRQRFVWYPLHQICASQEPSLEEIYNLLENQGTDILNVEDDIGAKAMEYFNVNPNVEFDQWGIMRIFVLRMMGQCA